MLPGLRDDSSRGLTFWQLVPNEPPIVALQLDALSQSGIVRASVAMSMRAAGRGATWTASLRAVGLLSGASGVGLSGPDALERAAQERLGASSLLAAALPHSGALRTSATVPTADGLELHFSLLAADADASQVGVHVYQLVVSDSASSSQLLAVPVLVHVRMPRAAVRPGSLTLLASNAAPGSSSVERAFTVKSAGSSALRWSVVLPADAPCWMSVSVAVPSRDFTCRPVVPGVAQNASCEASGLMLPSTMAVVTVVLHTALIPPGVHSSEVWVLSTDPSVPLQRVRVSGISSPLSICPTQLSLGDASSDGPFLHGDAVLSNTADGDVLVLGALASDESVQQLQPGDRCAAGGNASLASMLGIIRSQLLSHAVVSATGGMQSPHSGWLWPWLPTTAARSGEGLLAGLPASVRRLWGDMQSLGSDRAQWWNATQYSVLMGEAVGVADPTLDVLAGSSGFPVLLQQGERLQLAASALYTPQVMSGASSTHVVHLVVWEAARGSLSVRSVPVSAGSRVGRTDVSQSAVIQLAAELPGGGLGISQDLQEVAVVGGSQASRAAVSMGRLVAVFSLRDRYGLPRPPGFDTVSLQVGRLNSSSAAMKPLTWVQALTSVQMGALLDPLCSSGAAADLTQLDVWSVMLSGGGEGGADACALYRQWQAAPWTALSMTTVQGVFVRPTRRGAAALTISAQETVLAVETRASGVTITQQGAQVFVSTGRVLYSVQLQRRWPSPALALPVRAEAAECSWSEGMVLGADGLTCTCAAGLVQSSDALPLMMGAEVTRIPRVSAETGPLSGVVDSVSPVVTSGTLQCVACSPGQVSSRATLHAGSRRGVCNPCADDSFAFPGSTICQVCPDEIAKCTQGRLMVAAGYGLTADAASVLSSILTEGVAQAGGSPLDSAAAKLATLIQKCPNVFACKLPTEEDLTQLVEQVGPAGAARRLQYSDTSGMSMPPVVAELFACTSEASCCSLTLNGGALLPLASPSNVSAVEVGAQSFAASVGLNVSLSVSPSQCAAGHISGAGVGQLCSRCAEGFVHSPPVAASGGVCTSCGDLSTNLMELCISIGAYFVILLAILHSWHRLMVTTSLVTSAPAAAVGSSTAYSVQSKASRGGRTLAQRSKARSGIISAAGVNPMFLVRKHAVRGVLAAETRKALGAGTDSKTGPARAQRKGDPLRHRDSTVPVGVNPMLITSKHAVAAVLHPKAASPLPSAGGAQAGARNTNVSGTKVLGLPAGGQRRRAPAAARREALTAQQQQAEHRSSKRPTVHPQILRASAGVLLVLHLMLSGMVADVVVDHTSSGRMKQLLAGQHEVAAGIVPLPIHSVAWSCLTERFLHQVPDEHWLHSSATRQVVLFAFLPFASGVVAMGMAGAFALCLLLVGGDTLRTLNTEQTLVQMPSVFSMVWHAWWLAVAVALPRSMTGLLRVASVWRVAGDDSAGRVVLQWDMLAGSPEHLRLVVGALGALLVQVAVLVVGVMLVMRWARGADGAAAAGQPGTSDAPGRWGCSDARRWRYCPLPLPISWSFLVSRRKSPLLPPSVPAYVTPLLLPGVVWGCATLAALTTALVAQSNLSTYSLCFAFTAVWLCHEALRSYEVADSLETRQRTPQALKRAGGQGTRRTAGASMDSIKNNKVALLGTRSLALQRILRVFEQRYMPAAAGGSVKGMQSSGDASGTVMTRVARGMRHQRIALHVLTSIVMASCVAQAGMAYLLYAYESSVFLTDSRYSSTMEETFDVHGAIKACFIVLVGAFWGPLLLLLGAMLPWRIRGAMLAPVLSGPLPWLGAAALRCATQSVMLGAKSTVDTSADDRRPIVKGMGTQSTTAAPSPAVYKSSSVGAISQRRQRQQSLAAAASRGALPRALECAALTGGGALEMQSNPLQLAQLARERAARATAATQATGGDDAADEIVHSSNPLQQARQARTTGRRRGSAAAWGTAGFGATSVRRDCGGADLSSGGIVLRHNLSAAFDENKRSSKAVLGNALTRESPIAPRGARRAMRKVSDLAAVPGAEGAAGRARSRRRRKERMNVLG